MSQVKATFNLKNISVCNCQVTQFMKEAQTPNLSSVGLGNPNLEASNCTVFLYYYLSYQFVIHSTINTGNTESSLLFHVCNIAGD